jgi:hypothetical protein
MRTQGIQYRVMVAAILLHLSSEWGSNETIFGNPLSENAEMKKPIHERENEKPVKRTG